MPPTKIPLGTSNSVSKGRYEQPRITDIPVSKDVTNPVIPTLNPPLKPTKLRKIRMSSSILMRRGLSERFSAPLLPVKPYSRNLWLYVLLLLIVGTSQAALYVDSSVGVYVNAVAFACLMWLALWQERSRQIVIAVSLIPLVMLVGLSLPQASVFQRTTIISGLLLTLGLIYRYLYTLDYPVEGTKLRMTRQGYLFAIPFMIILGQFLGLIGYGLLRNQYDFKDTPLALVALGAIVFAIAEEVLFRGLIQQRAMLIFHPIIAATLSAALYTTLTIGQRGGLLTPIYGAIVGVVLSAVYYRKQNLLLTISINASAKLTYIGLIAIFVLRN